MKAIILTLLVALALPIAVSVADEIDPPPVGGGTRYTRQVNDQVVEVTTWGPTLVDFVEISPARVRGHVVRTDPSAPTCTATILWVNTGLQQTISVGIGVPSAPFAMESGDIDKRNGDNQNN